MSTRPRLAYGVALPLVIYIVLTVIWILPDWSALDSTQAFSVISHLGGLAFVIATLFFQPRMGCWFTLAWCVFVPFERYVLLLQEMISLVSGAPLSLAGIDIVRIFLLLIGGALAGALVFVLHFRRSKSASVQADA